NSPKSKDIIIVVSSNTKICLPHTPFYLLSIICVFDNPADEQNSNSRNTWRVPSSPNLKVQSVLQLQVLEAFVWEEINNPFGAFFAACAAVLVSCIETIFQFLCGKSFLESAKNTWKLVKDRGIEAIINDYLIGNVFDIAEDPNALARTKPNYIKKFVSLILD
ncbi:11179_t:CDS:2, partial [Funneliformis caledonium]